MPEELQKPKQKHALTGLKAQEMNFGNSVIIPTLTIGLFSLAIRLATKLPEGADWRVVSIEAGIFTAFLFVLTLTMFIITKHKIASVEAAPKTNDFLPAIEQSKFTPSTIPIPPNYPVHPDFVSTVRMLRGVSYLKFFAIGGMILITLFSRFPHLPDPNMFGLSCVFLIAVLPILYIYKVFLYIEWNLRELSWDYAHSDIYEFELYSVIQEAYGQHMAYTLSIRVGDTLKNFVVNPMRKSNGWFEKLKLEKNLEQKISCYVNHKTGEPTALATQMGPVWLSSNEMHCFLPPKPGLTSMTPGRLIVPLSYKKGLKLITDKSSSTISNSKFLGKWEGLCSFDHTPRIRNAFIIDLALGPNGELSGTYTSKLLGKLYGKITVEARAEGNELYLRIVYHTFLIKLIEKPELWAGIFDPSKEQINGTFEKGTYSGIFIMKKVG